VIHVVIPAAGAGSRFVAAGYASKIHADVRGVPMLRAVVDNVRSFIGLPHRVTVVTTTAPPDLGDDVEVVRLEQPTRGAVETILAAGIDPDETLLVANCDQLVRSEFILTDPADGWIGTFTSTNEHHSYVRTFDGVVDGIAEKRVISNEAVAGVYVFRGGELFNAAATAVLDRDERVLGEFYLSTVLAEMVRRGNILRTFRCEVDILGTPEELDRYLGRVTA
jgi:bifunctional N-acetylglucosamine-1-phosphate-uridyltransferase/glucosamine-1-phosphate-acetyltransferase GlmU-like protein